MKFKYDKRAGSYLKWKQQINRGDDKLMEALKTVHIIYGDIAYSNNLGNDTLWIHKSVEHARVAYVWKGIFWRGLIRVGELREDRVSNALGTYREATKEHEYQ